MKDQAIIYYYFADGTYQSGSHFILTNLQLKLLKYLGKSNRKLISNDQHGLFSLDEHDIKSSRTNEKFHFGDDRFLADAIAAIPIPIIIVVDGLEKVIENEEAIVKSKRFS